MNIVVFGPTGGVGREIVKQALARGHEVTAFARSPDQLGVSHERLHAVRGDVFDRKSVEPAIAGHEAVLCALGGSIFRQDNVCSEGTRNILAAMASHGLRRLIVCSSNGVGESRANIPFFLRLLIARPLADKEIQEGLVRASAVDWIIVRPPGLRDAPARGALAVAVPGPLPSRRIARADVAAFMLDQLTSDTYLRKTPAISWKA